MKVLSYFIIILLTPTLILLNYRSLVFSQEFYEQEYQKLGVYNNFDSRLIVNLQTKKLLNYYCCQESLDPAFYSQRETMHLQDVKQLIRMADYLLLFFLVPLLLITVTLAFHKKIKLLLNTYFYAPVVTLASLAILWLTTLINFNFIFINFHLVSFSNDYWLLPQSANLIKLFPQQFFVDFANKVALNTAIMSVVIIFITYLITHKYDSKKH